MVRANQILSWGVYAVLNLAVITSVSATETIIPNNSSYTLFESGQVRPLALSPDGKRLFAVNTPDNHLEVFDTTGQSLRHCGSLTVGLEPIALAVRNKREVWVVNHVSDSVSIVRIDKQVCDQSKQGKRRSRVGHIKRTLLVGDEPRDIVFAGDERKRAFITTAHRGQNAPFDPQLTTPGIGRADVWVFDAGDQGDSLQGDPLNIITLFTNTPRALAVSSDGKKVYAAGFNTGNQTTTLHEVIVTANGGLPGPHTNGEGIEQPHTGLIVKYDGEHWRDEDGRIWDEQVKFSLPDKDVFIIDATANPPVAMDDVDSVYRGVGSTLFNMVVNPKNGSVYVSNLQARNENRFEGPGVTAGQTLRGHFIENRITVLKNDQVIPRHLNKHIDYSQCCDPIPNNTNDRSLAFPTDLAISKDGSTLYVAALGSSKVGIFDTEALEDGSFVPDDASHVEVSGGGPSGVVLDERRNRLYVMTRFDNAISVVDTKKAEEIQHLGMHNPEPAHIISGRRFMYDARYTSSHGDSACAGCHIYGDIDYLAWDLGNPDGSELNNPNGDEENKDELLVVDPRNLPGFENFPIHFRPMKGPMTTQSFRGMANHGALHWRGDKTGGNHEPSFQPNSGVYNEDFAFKEFNGAFEGLIGRHEVLSDEEMQAFSDYALEIMYPPNPIRNLDNSLTGSQQAGHDFFFGGLADPFAPCSGCHATDRAGNAEYGVSKPGFFGADGRATFELEPQIFKIPHLRNMYQKVGMFGMAKTNGFILPESDDPNVDNAFMGDQVNGFGYLHDGSVDTVFRFINIVFFQHAEEGPFPNPGGFAVGPEGDVQRRQVEDFVFAFDSNFAPIIGQQLTLTESNVLVVESRLQLLLQRAELGECDLVAMEHKRNRERGYLYIGDGLFKTDTVKRRPISEQNLRDRIHRGSRITYTCVPPVSGHRIALDRDEDGILNGDEYSDKEAEGSPRKQSTDNLFSRIRDWWRK